MYAIVDIAGQQIKVEKGQEVFVNRLESKEGSKVNFKNVLIIDNNGKVSVGKPILNGHRQYLSKVVIEGISEKAAPKAKKAEPKTAPKAEVKVEAKKVAKPKVEAKPKAKAKPKAEAKPKATTTKAAATKKTEPKTEKK